MSQKKPTEILDITISDLEELTDEQLELITGGTIVVDQVNSTTPISFNPQPEPPGITGLG